MHGDVVIAREDARRMADRVVLGLRMAFDAAVSAVALQRAPGPAAAIAALHEALEAAETVGDVSLIAAGASWWASAQALVKLWTKADDNVRRDTAPAVAGVLGVVSKWQAGAIGAPPAKAGPGVN